MREKDLRLGSKGQVTEGSGQGEDPGATMKTSIRDRWRKRERRGTADRFKAASDPQSGARMLGGVLEIQACSCAATATAVR